MKRIDEDLLEVFRGKKRGCSVAGCDRQHCARGWCRIHYIRWWEHGTTELLRGPAKTRNRQRVYTRRLYPVLGNCQRCDGKATERHHVDDNTANNSLENIRILCRRCHMIEDGRLDKLLMFSKTRIKKPPTPCNECGRLYKPLRKGICSRCYDRKRPSRNRKP